MMRVFVTGASGLLGSELCARLLKSGHEVISLVRRTPSNENQRQWDPTLEDLDPSVISGCDALIHLAGESIADGRWTAKKKKRIYESRVHSTKLLANTIAKMEIKPQVFVTASAIGFYGDRGSETLIESSSPGEGYLPEVCVDWENAANPAIEAGVRTAHVRTGVVLAKEGGALKSMITPFKLGLGGTMGDGEQFWSWISLGDIARIFQFAVENEQVVGPINGTAPQPCTNREFTKVLGKTISRPTILPVPKFAAKLLLGEMADALILASANVLPAKAEEHGFEFLHPELQAALTALEL